MSRRFWPYFSEVNAILHKAGADAPLIEVGKQFMCFGWAHKGASFRSFSKEQIKVDLWDTLPRLGTVVSGGSCIANIIVALSPVLHGLAALNLISRMANRTSTPTVVVAPVTYAVDYVESPRSDRSQPTNRTRELNYSSKL